MRRLILAGLVAASLGLGIPAALASGSPPAPPGSERGSGGAFGACLSNMASSGTHPRPGTLTCMNPVGLFPG